MLDVGSSELLLIVVVAVVFIGPKDLPRALYKLGQIIGKGRAMTRHFRAGIDEMVRQAELEELEKKWAADNARIMAQTQGQSYAQAQEVPTVEAAEPAALPAPSAGAEALASTPDAVPAAAPVETAPPAKGEGGPAA